MEDFILELDSALTSGSSDKRHIFKILLIIKHFFEADACLFDVFDSPNEVVCTNRYNEVNRVDINNLHIINPKKEVTENMKRFLIIYQNNLHKIYDLWKESNIDKLTQVCNFAALSERISNSSFNNVGVSFIDANGLSIINNNFGHEEGDKLLKTVALVLNKLFRQTDIYRKGGDEFVVICENISKEQFCERIEKAKLLLNFTEYSASFGIAYDEYTNDISSLIIQADQAMYEEKNRFKLENPDKARRRLSS